MTETTIQSLLLKITIEETRIIERSPVLVYADPETLVLRTDESLQELGKESENITEVIFVLEPSWLKAGDVVATKKPLMHKLVTELALRPIGFLLQSEALVQNSLSHNAHFSSILLLITTSQIAVTILSQGKVGTTQFVGRSQDIASDLQEAFARYLHEKKEAHLPGKLICASFSLTEEELVACQQRLLDTSWGEKAAFVQTPTIDVIKPELALSIIAQQAGNAVMGLHQTQVHPMDKKQASAHQPAKEAKEMGFDDVSHNNLLKVDDEERAVEVAQEFLPTSFGIPIKQAKFEETAVDDEERAVEAPTMAALARGGILDKIFKTSPADRGKHNPKVFIAVGFLAGLVALVVGGYLWLLFFTTVEARVKPITKTVASDVLLTLDPKLTEPDAANLRIPAQTVTKSLTTQTNGTTSGVKIVGEKSVGEVVIYNKTTSQKTFAAGTVIEQGELQFLLDKEITVDASKVEQSSSNQETKTFGEAKAAVTAYVIGVEGNIAKDSELTVANFDKSTYSAKTVGELTGGSSREIRVVAKEDRDLLLSEAKKNLLRDAQEQFKAESGNGTFILPTEEVVITKATYSDELEAVADELTLDVEGAVSAVSYKISDLVPLAQSVLGDKVPPGYTLSNADPEILSAPSKGSDTQAAVTLQANLSATAVPQLDPSLLRAELAGKPLSQAEGIFRNTGVIQSSTVIFKPDLAKSLIKKLPKDQNKIIVTWDQEE